MLKKIYKTIEADNGKITIYGSNRPIKLHSAVPEWNRGPGENNEPEDYFNYRGIRYYLSQFPIPSNFSPFKEFDGVHNDTFFSGVLIKLSDTDCNEDHIKAYTFIS